jgi:hypothetical protein
MQAGFYSGRKYDSVIWYLNKSSEGENADAKTVMGKRSVDYSY